MASSRARELRRNMTDAEAKLWSALRSRQLNGHKFRRQQRIGPYIVDFVCHECRLIVEIDGGQHAAMDETIRSQRIETDGYRIIRFWNNEVLQNLEGVLTVISNTLSEDSPSPSRR